MSNSLGTTQIDHLPTTTSSSGNIEQNNNPVQTNNNSNSENIKIENYGQQLNMERQNESNLKVQPIDYTSQLTSVLKDAKSSGATVLPSRDIPQQTIHIQQDIQTKADYIPTNKTNDYIGNILDKEKIILEQKQKQNQSDNFDYIYQTIQLPVLVGIIYFLFQLPFIRKNLLTFLPNLFNKDGMPKLSGYIFNSIMFALLYAFLVKGIKYMQ